MNNPTERRMSDLELRRRRLPQYRVVAYAYGHEDEMENPELLYLRYDVTIDGKSLTLAHLPQDEFLLESFRCCFRKGQLHPEQAQLEATPDDPSTSWREAQQHLHRPLTNWEAFSELSGHGSLHFILRHFALVNRAQDPVGPRNCVATLSDAASPDSPNRPAMLLSPPPPRGWQSDELVETLRIRWREILEYRSSPLVEGNFTLTAIESRFGSRKKAAAALNIDRRVLHMLAVICLADDPIVGRKLGKGSANRGLRGRTGPMTPAEAKWLLVVAQEIMLRLGGRSWRTQRLSLADLPELGIETVE